MTGCIDRFDGEHRFLSNFWAAPVRLDGWGYPSVENAYQAAKTLVVSERVPFQKCSAFEAKKLGRTLTLRADWEAAKRDEMVALLIQKFSHAHLCKLLVATGDAELIEGNHWGDTYWGVCRGKGENHLGKLLMMVREACILGVIP